MNSNGVLINKKFIPVLNWESTVIELCDSLNLLIPRFCYHSKLSIAGNCRMCLIEVESSVKPVLACATTLTKNLSIRTHSDFVKKAREGVLEFLLINHPLDCPICDQAGECDLQDQSLIYGSDKGRFIEPKRSVEDKYFGPYVKSIMTRCIHCTRCVRFLEELTDSGSLGTMGRGRDTEISQYIKSGIQSGLSGNLIDICPVGALTSKPYAFRGRPWELRNVEVIDILDSLGSSIRLDFKGSEIMRILPKKNDLVNEDWITDKVRFCYDTFKRDRLANPLYKVNEKYTQVSWNFIFNFFTVTLSKLLLSHRLQISYGQLTDLFTIFMISRICNVLAVKSNIYYYGEERSYLFSGAYQEIEKFSNFFILGSHLLNQLPLLFNRIRKKMMVSSNTFVIYLGKNINKSLPCFSHIGISEGFISLFLLGKIRSSFTPLLTSKNSFLFKDIQFSHLEIANLSQLQVRSTRLRINESISSITASKESRPARVNYIINDHVVPIDFLNNAVCSVYQGHHGSGVSSYCQVILPSLSYLEDSLPFYNLTGSLDWSRKVTNSVGVAISSDVLLRKLYLSLLDHEYENSYVDFLMSYPDSLSIFSNLRFQYPQYNYLCIHAGLLTSNKTNWTNDSVLTDSSLLLNSALI